MTVPPMETQATFQPGFRISARDVGVLVVGAIASSVLWTIEWWYGLLIAFVVTHFFLFCNMFRIARILELVWSGLFVALMYCTVAIGQPSWPISITASLLVAAIMVAVEMRKPSYHGILWQWINPGLPGWWETQVNSVERGPGS